MSAATIAMTKPSKSKRKFLNAKVSTRALQLARIACAYKEGTNMSELMSDILEPALLKILEKLGVVIPPDPDK